MVHWTHPTQHPKLHVDRRAVLGTAHGRAERPCTLQWTVTFSLKIVSSHGGGSVPRSSLVHPSKHPKRHHDRFSRLCMVQGGDRQADRPTYYSTPPIAIAPLLLRYGLIKLIDLKTIGLTKTKTKWFGN